MAELKQEDQLEHIYSSCVRIRNVAQKTCQRRWTIGKSGKRGSEISVLVARHDDEPSANYFYEELLIEVIIVYKRLSLVTWDLIIALPSELGL